MLSLQLRTFLQDPRTRGVVTASFGVAAVAWMIASVHDWPSAIRRIGQTPSLALLGALALIAGAGILAMRSWVAVLPNVAENTRPWGRVFFVGQLGKYMPGSVWAAALQAHLARELGASHRQLFGGFVFAFGTSIMCAGLLGFWAAQSQWGTLTATVLAVISLTGLCLTAILANRAPLVRITGLKVRPSNVAASAGWSVLGWVMSGAHLAVLCIAFGAPVLDALLVATAAAALSVGIGSLAVLAPGGIGIREIVLLQCLTTVIEPSAAAAVVVVSRVLYLVADLLLAIGSTVFSPRIRTVS